MIDRSSFWSPYHKWFVELGYPDCDIIEYDDGEWAIIQTYNSPVIPHLCRWNYVLKGIRHVIPTFGIVERFMHQHDPMRREYWEFQNAQSAAVEREHDFVTRTRAEYADKRAELCLRNPSLMDRVGRNGLQELSMRNISRHIPNSAFR